MPIIPVGRNATKLKEFSGDPIPLTVDFADPNAPMIRGKATLEEFTKFLSGFINPTGFINFDLPSYVADKTGLTGLYDWYLKLDPLLLRIAAQGDLNVPTNRRAEGLPVSTSVQEQLGLKLESQRAPVEVLVIDSAERPDPD